LELKRNFKVEMAMAIEIACRMPPATCHLPPATCHLPPATSHLSTANWQFKHEKEQGSSEFLVKLGLQRG